MSVVDVSYKTLKSAPRETSAFSFKDLSDINNPVTSYKSALAVIGHIDLNAFFAQVEQLRLGLTRDDPVVCVQWSSLIAVSYAARKFGIGRMDNVKTSRVKCPNIVLAHAAVFKKGQSHWAYEEGLPSQFTHKVSLDPYRRESRKIISIFNQLCDLVEKASVDESYLDIGRLVYERLMRDFPMLREENRDGQSGVGLLPAIPKELPDTLRLVGESDGIDVVTDWDDVCMCIGSEIIHEIRQEVYKILGYTTSGGVARNKFIAKLAGGLFKPDNQAVVFNRSVYKFLNQFELTDIGGMGGKTGDEVIYKLQVGKQGVEEAEDDGSGDGEGQKVVSSITRIRENFTLEDLRASLADDEIAEKVYNLVRGNSPKELTLKVEVKSMMSRKNFPGKPVTNLLDAYDWIKVFVGDLYNRLIESDDESMNISASQASKQRPTIRRPKTVSLHFGTLEYTSHSKQATILMVQDLEKFKVVLEATAIRLLKELLDTFQGTGKLNNGLKLRDVKDITKDIKILGCTSMSLTISNFTKTSNANLIDSFINKNPDSTSTREEEFTRYSATTPSPTKQLGHSTLAAAAAAAATADTQLAKPLAKAASAKQGILQQLQSAGTGTRTTASSSAGSASPTPAASPLPTFFCAKCKAQVSGEAAEHDDFHVASELSRQLNGSSEEQPRETNEVSSSASTPNDHASSAGSSKRQNKKRKVNTNNKGKGQSTLPWGKPS